MNTTHKHHRLLIGLSLLLIVNLLLAGCGSQPPAAVEAAATVAPSKTLPASTATPVPTETPAPTLTLTPTPTRTATKNVWATQSVKQTATQQAFNDSVEEQLAAYGIDPEIGEVTWRSKSPYTLDGSGYGLIWYRPIGELGVMDDFVLQMDVTWDTSGGLSGCGFIFRGREDMDLEIGDFYHLFLMRMQYEPRWFIEYYEDGIGQYALPGWEGVVSGNLNDEKMSKNTVTLDAHGETLTVYINGVKERSVENNKLTEGRLALMVVQESGTSYCKFDNGWLWEYDEVVE